MHYCTFLSYRITKKYISYRIEPELEYHVSNYNNKQIFPCGEHLSEIIRIKGICILNNDFYFQFCNYSVNGHFLRI